MKIVSWNVNGIRSAFRKGLLDFIEKEKPDILCLQEIKACENQIPKDILDLHGYYTFFNPAIKKGYAGTAIISKVKPIEVKFGIGIKKFDIEGRIISLRFSNFILFNLYFPHGSRDKKKIPLKMDMYKAIIKLVKNSKKTILCGDFNVARDERDLARPKENDNNTMFTVQERLCIGKIIENGFLDTFRNFNSENGNYTWWPYYRNARQRNLGWRIDYIFVSKDMEKKINRAFILPEVKGSDHCPVRLVLT